MKRKRFLQTLAFGIPLLTVNSLDYQVNVEQKTPQQAASEWIAANTNRFNSWLRN